MLNMMLSDFFLDHSNFYEYWISVISFGLNFVTSLHISDSGLCDHEYLGKFFM